MVLAAVGQFCATQSLTQNASAIRTLIHKTSQAGASVLFLPEASDYIAGSPAETIKLAVPIDQNEVIQAGIKKALSELPEGAIKPYVSIGVHEPATTSGDGSGRVKNTLLWFDQAGQLLNRYQKIHLFDVDITNGPILKESKSVEPGNKVLQPFDSPIGKSMFVLFTRAT